MATKNLLLNIKAPTDRAVEELVFTKVAAANDYLRIPRRYPFVDIANISHLRSIGYFRHKVAGSYNDNVSTDYGSNATNTEGNLGFQLPQTEKLFLVVKGAADGATLTVEGSLEYGIPDHTFTIPAGAGKIYVLDTFDFGLFVRGVAGEDGVMIKVAGDGAATVEVALVARAV